MQILQIPLIILSFFAAPTTNPNPHVLLCPSIQQSNESEGNWPISEKVFTEQTANKEHERLARLLGKDGLGADAVAWQNAIIYIEGWLLRRQALEAIKSGHREPYVSDFCRFMKTRAFIQH